MSTRAELERRREELAGRVAELHWDLGGLAYEMAIRDHFRNDVLLSRAAQLQELDTELAEVERRLGDARAQDDGPGGVQARKAWSRVLPPVQVSMMLLVVFLGFGVAVGMAAKGSRSTRPRAREVLIAQAPAAAARKRRRPRKPPRRRWKPKRHRVHPRKPRRKAREKDLPRRPGTPTRNRRAQASRAALRAVAGWAPPVRGRAPQKAAVAEKAHPCLPRSSRR